MPRIVNQGIRTTMGVVGACLFAFFGWAIFALVGWKVGAILVGVLLYEGWTLVDKHPNNTISEILWMLASRPSVPWLFGAVTVFLIEKGIMVNPYIVGAVLYLEGHFFFQSQSIYDNLQAENLHNGFFRDRLKRYENPGVFRD